MSEPLLLVEDLVRRFEGAAETVTVLDGLRFRLERGAAASVVGASGSGKSTLLHLIGGLDRPSAGRVLLDGRSLGEAGDAELARLRADTVGFVFQDHHLLPQLSALENVLVPTLAQRGEAASGATARATALLERVGLAELAHRLPHELSGGQRQRVAVVRALINEPALVLADEPTGSLDRTASDALVDLLLELERERGVALVVVTHSERVAERVGGIHHLRDGRLHAAGTAECTSSG